MTDFRPQARRIPLDYLEIEDGDLRICFEAVGGLSRKLDAFATGLLGRFERLLGRYSFMAMFATALAVSFISTRLVDLAVLYLPSLGHFIGRHYLGAAFVMVLFQLVVLSRLFSRELPTWMDNAYRNENRADNLQSLRRTGRA